MPGAESSCKASGTLVSRFLVPPSQAARLVFGNCFELKRGIGRLNEPGKVCLSRTRSPTCRSDLKALEPFRQSLNLHPNTQGTFGVPYELESKLFKTGL